MKIRWNKVIVAGVIFFVIAFVIRQIEAILTMKYYAMPELFGVWSKVMMPKAGPPPISFHITSALFTLVTGLTLAAFYDFVKGALSGGFWPRIFKFTTLVFWLAFVFFALTSYLLFNVPVALQIWWLLSSLVVYFLSTIAFAKILK